MRNLPNNRPDTPSFQKKATETSLHCLLQKEFVIFGSRVCARSVWRVNGSHSWLTPTTDYTAAMLFRSLFTVNQQSAPTLQHTLTYQVHRLGMLDQCVCFAPLASVHFLRFEQIEDPWSGKVRRRRKLSVATAYYLGYIPLNIRQYKAQS